MTRTDSASNHFFPAVVFACFSQVRDCTDNDNRTTAMEVREARVVAAWAASRSQDPAFAPFVYAAAAQAQATFARHRPRAVC